MENTNFYVVIGLAVSIFTTLGMGFYLIPKQIAELKRPRNWLTPLRQVIFILLVISVLGSMPTIMYQIVRAMGGEIDWLRNAASISASVSRLSTFMLMVYIFKFKAPDNE